MRGGARKFTEINGQTEQTKQGCPRVPAQSGAVVGRQARSDSPRRPLADTYCCLSVGLFAASSPVMPCLPLHSK